MIRLICRVIWLLTLFSVQHGEIVKVKDCKFITCRDCATVGCLWTIYFNKNQNCLSSTKGIPGVEATVDDPKECDHPTCVHPDHNPWDSTGLAQLLGGLFGGLFAGVCGGATFLSWRRRRAGGYERLGGGGRPWMEWARAFCCAFLNRLQRAEDGDPFLQGDDAENERQRQAAARRIIAREAAARRQAENLGQDNQRPQAPPGPPPPQQVHHDNPADNLDNQNEAIVNPPGIIVAQAEAPDNNAAPVVDNPVVDPLADDGDDNDNGDEDSDEEDGDDNDDDGERAGPSPLVQQVIAARRSNRIAATEAGKSIKSLKSQRQI